MINYEIPHNEESYEEHIIAIHLKEVISDNTAKKIINGVPVQKDGKPLINKKSIKTFLTYLADEMYKIASEQRNKQTKKDKKNWTALAKDGNFIIERALAYFDDDTIHGELYDESGKLYKAAPTETPKNVVRTVQATTVTRKPEPPKPQQFTLFSFLEEQKNSTSTPVEEDAEDLDEDETDTNDTDELEDNDEKITKEDPSLEYEVNMETGEILGKKVKTEPDIPPSFSTFLQFKNQYPTHIILYRVGDFFETFNDDAKTLSRDFNLILTGRYCGKERVPMIGIPFHAIEPYIFKISAKYPLVLIDGDKIEIIPIAPTEQDEDIDDDELSEEEMQEFDGYMGEPIPAKTPVKEDTDDEDDLEDLLAYKKFIDSDALAVFIELFDGELDIQ